LIQIKNLQVNVGILHSKDFVAKPHNKASLKLLVYILVDNNDYVKIRTGVSE